MKNELSACPDSRETLWGFTYLAFQMLFLPVLLSVLNWKLPRPLDEAQLNFVFFLVNFLAVAWIFRRFLGRSFRQLRARPGPVFRAVVLGLAAYFACAWVIGGVTERLLPEFANANDASISAMGRKHAFLILLGTVVLVPPVEECLYRGLIFRNLYKRSPVLAYAVSTVAFALIHIMGYLGRYSPLETAFAILQYLPAGLCLAWAYIKGGTIAAPIAIHAIVNLVGVYRMR